MSEDSSVEGEAPDVDYQPVIGFVGLGNMGSPMAKRLIMAGYQVVCYDLNPEALDDVANDGGFPAESAAQVAASCDIFCTSLPRPDHVMAVMSGEAGALPILPP